MAPFLGLKFLDKSIIIEISRQDNKNDQVGLRIVILNAQKKTV